jgi:hypothetical protein
MNLVFNNNLTEEELFNSIKETDEFYRKNLERYHTWKAHYKTLNRQERKYYGKLGKPFKPDPIAKLSRYKYFSDEILYKHRKIIFNSYFRLNRMFYSQKIPLDIIISYRKRIEKDSEVFDSFIYQLTRHHRVIFDDNITDIIMTNWDKFLAVIEKNNPASLEIIKETFKDSSLLLLLRFEEDKITD